MGSLDHRQRWGWVAQALHWGMAVMILANMAIGLIADAMPLSPDKLQLYLWHKSLGMSVLGLAVIRLLWRLAHGGPELPPSLPDWQRRIAAASHGMLYSLMFIMPISGWLLNSAANVPLRWFGWLRLPAIAPPSELWKERLEVLHQALFWMFAALVIVHAAAALKHHFVDRDNVLKRMLPGGDDATR